MGKRIVPMEFYGEYASLTVETVGDDYGLPPIEMAVQTRHLPVKCDIFLTTEEAQQLASALLVKVLEHNTSHE